MTRSGYVFLGLTAIVAALVSGLAFTVLKLFAAARESAAGKDLEGGETAFMAAAMEEAVGRLKTQERGVRTLNPAGRRLLGLPDAEWSGRFTEVLAAVQPLADLIQECFETSQPIVRRTIALAAPTGAASHLGVTVSPILDDTGKAHGAICLFSDLSAIVELEEQLRLKDSLARLGELTAGIAHEFRNGLATIHGYGRLLDLDRLPQDFRTYVQGIRTETEALGQVVTNFLNFARPTELTLA